MLKVIKDIFSLITNFIRGKELFEVEIFPIAKQETLKHLYYICRGCKKIESLILNDQSTDEQLIEFWRRWGPLDESLKLIYQMDGSYKPEHFCPKCQYILENQVKKYLYGYHEIDINEHFPLIGRKN